MHLLLFSAMPSTCPHCDKAFQRPEHLKRHVGAVHERDGQDFPCATCGKTFSRSDSLLRHERNHSGSAGITVLEHGRRTHRACDNCAAARTKCDGADRCARCRGRQLACVYSQRQSTKPSDNLSVEETLPTPSQRLRADESLQHVGSDQGLPSDVESVPPLNGAFYGQSEQNVGVLGPDVDVLWSENMNWLPVGNGTTMQSMPEMEMGQLWSSAQFPALTPGPLESIAHAPGLPTPDLVGRSEGATVSPASAGSASSPDSGARAKKRRLDRYVDGRGARDSLQNISRYPHEAVGSHAYDADGGVPAVVAFPEKIHGVPEAIGHRHGLRVGINKYAEIRDHFANLVTSTSNVFTPRLLSTHFPSPDYVEHCFDQYSRHVQPEWPVVHNSTWTEASAPWFLVLAVVTCGAARETSETGQRAFVAFSEFLRRALNCIEESGEHRGSLAFAQASLLHAAASARLPGRLLAQRLSTALANMTVAVAALPSIVQSGSEAGRRKGTWHHWITAETHRRVLHFEWQFRLFVSVSLGEDHQRTPAHDIALPCPSAWWEAQTAEAWAALPKGNTPPRLWPALERLYTTHTIDPEIDSVGQRLLVYAVVDRTREVHQHLQQPLRQWSPAPDEDSSADDTADDTLSSVGWLPANPEYAAWRNSACDCLDTLHWKANSDIATAKGLEGPVILHLHLARLIVLCPYTALIQLATDFAQSTGISARPSPDAQPFNTTPASQRAFDEVAKWMTLDDHKQRLSLVHAGSVFWHIRRYSRGHFSEPFAIFISTLAIWFSACFQPSLQASMLQTKSRLASQRATAASDQSAAENPASEEDDTVPTSILLDRPCDDEIVQIFVRRGHDMQVLMSGAGAINTPPGMRRVLEQGIKLLRYAHYANHGRCAEYERVLEGVARRSYGAGA